jgi:cell division septation protein DedD
MSKMKKGLEKAEAARKSHEVESKNDKPVLQNDFHEESGMFSPRSKRRTNALILLGAGILVLFVAIYTYMFGIERGAPKQQLSSIQAKPEKREIRSSMLSKEAEDINTSSKKQGEIICEYSSKNDESLNKQRDGFAQEKHPLEENTPLRTSKGDPPPLKEDNLNHPSDLIPSQVSSPGQKTLQDLHPSSKEDPTEKTSTAVPQYPGEGMRATTSKNFYPYTILVCSSQSKKRSNALAFELRSKGHLAFTCPAKIPGKGDWYRVFIGYYERLEETRQAASKLNVQHFTKPLEAKMPFAVQIGILNSEDELKKLEANLLSKAYLAYSILDGPENKKIKLLLGAYRTEKDASTFAQKLKEEGYNPKVVRR